VKHAEYMLALRITRKNDDREAYWATVGKHASRAKAANLNRPTVSQKAAAGLHDFGSHPRARFGGYLLTLDNAAG